MVKITVTNVEMGYNEEEFRQKTKIPERSLANFIDLTDIKEAPEEENWLKIVE